MLQGRVDAQLLLVETERMLRDAMRRTYYDLSGTWPAEIFPGEGHEASRRHEAIVRAVCEVIARIIDTMRITLVIPDALTDLSALDVQVLERVYIIVGTELARRQAEVTAR